MRGEDIVMAISRSLVGELVSCMRRSTAGTLADRLAVLRPRPAALPRRVPRDRLAGDRLADRRRLLAELGVTLPVLTGGEVVRPQDGFAGNVENFIGVAQIPVGLIGPLRVNGLHAQGDFYVPLATTEGALVASHARGAGVIGESGGARALCVAQRVSRAPVFRFRDVAEAVRFGAFAVESFPTLQQVAGETTRHGRLEDVRVHWDGNLVYLLFEFSTGDAAGQNMVTIGSEAVVAYLKRESPVTPLFAAVESNLSGDKKASAMALQHVRGKLVIAEVEVPRAVVAARLHATPEAIESYWKTATLAALHAGTVGMQGQFANGLAALFLACGQDVACVAEAAVGSVRFERTDAGDLYVCVTLPNLIVGTVGGGTGLPTARECLGLLGCAGAGGAVRLAEVAAVLVLAGEISLAAALTQGDFARAHATLGRKPPRDASRSPERRKSALPSPARVF